MTMTTEAQTTHDRKSVDAEEFGVNAATEHASLKYSLLGPSLTKAGQDSVDQSKA
jgi:DNA polymerase kappa